MSSAVPDKLSARRQLTPGGAFVADMSAELQLGDRATDQRTRRVLRRLVEFAVAEGLPLQREVILDPDSVGRFVEVALAGEHSAATYRSTLRSVAPLLTTTSPWEPRPASLRRQALVAPYSSVEVKILREDASLQPNESLRRAALGLFALGRGAGLDGRWVAKVRATAVVKRGPFVIVSVGAPVARSVVVRAEWEHEVLDLASGAGGGFLLGGGSVSSNRTSHLTDSLVAPTGHPRLVPARLRSTWLLWHLTAGTRLPELCQAAGLKRLNACSDLVVYVAPLGDKEAAELLRGGAPADAQLPTQAGACRPLQRSSG